jgi:iron complex outermembrane recepter protein
MFPPLPGVAVAALLSALLPPLAQSPVAPGSQPAPAQSGQPAGRITLPPITVTAQKEPADPTTLPTSITAISEEQIDSSGITTVSDAAFYSPNTHFTEFTARKLSNPRMRGIGASPANPGVTTYIDGVPQFNASSSSLDLLDVGQIEFVRGAQGALFGRNALGGLINVTSRPPSMSAWTGSFAAPFGSADAFDLRASASGPIAPGKAAAGLSMQYGRRNGFTTNDLTGHDVDSRSAWSGKGQLLWTPAPAWVVRLILTGERARDGDYALNDLAEVRRNPYHVSRDFEGHTDRDVLATTILTRRSGSRIVLNTTTGIVRWKTVDLTDLDYSALPLATRNNAERAVQFTQEVRLASTAVPSEESRSNHLSFRWQAGALFFTQDYQQDAANTFAPFVLSPFVPVPVVNRAPLGELFDLGGGVYGQGTLAVGNRVDVSVGARVDYEHKEANLKTSFAPPIAPPTSVDAARQFSDVSPQVSAAFHVRRRTLAYASVGRGFKAGGFNPTSPPGNEAYGEEHAWHVEGGVKTSAAGDRVSASAAVFSIRWDDLQNNLPNPSSPGQFYIANVGGAWSRGIELELAARPAAGVDVFGAVGVTRARFDSGTSSGGVDVGGNTIANTPGYTATAGVQVAHALRPTSRLYGRLEVVRSGAFEYDDANTVGQDAYTLMHIRAGASGKVVFVEAWIRNVLDTRYVPVAFAYPGFAPSGFVGEPGEPRTFGVSVGARF